MTDDDAKRPSNRESAAAADGPSRGLRPFKLALAGIGLLFLAGSPFWSPLLMRRMSFFRVRRVEIIGAHYIAPSDILARIRVDTTASVWDPTAPGTQADSQRPERRRRPAASGVT